VLLLGLPFTENTHLIWLLPGVGVLLVLAAQQGGRQVWHAALIAAYAALALPFAEMAVWRAGGSTLGRISSGSECYGLAVLAACMAYAAFMCTAPGTTAQRQPSSASPSTTSEFRLRKAMSSPGRA